PRLGSRPDFEWHAPNTSNFAVQGDLAGHGARWFDRPAGQGRDNTHDEGNAGRGAFPGLRDSHEMYCNHLLLEPCLADAQFTEARPHNVISSLYGIFHDTTV